jgi:hypothetical protein
MVLASVGLANASGSGARRRVKRSSPGRWQPLSPTAQQRGFHLGNILYTHPFPPHSL